MKRSHRNFDLRQKASFFVSALHQEIIIIKKQKTNRTGKEQ